MTRSQILLTTAVVVSLFGNTIGQLPTYQDCLGAIPICQEIYYESQLPNGSGNYPNEVNPLISCTAGEIQAIWYTFTVNEDGNFGFNLTPNNPDDDYDWALFNLTNAGCEDIFNNQNLLVSCNASGGSTCNGVTGANGSSNFAIQGAGCNFFPPDFFFGYSPHNALIQVSAGNTYVLMISNWSNSGFGYTIDFGISDVSIFDQMKPELDSFSYPAICAGNKIGLFFSENLQCHTIDASNFQLNGPGGPFILSLEGKNCLSGGTYEHTFSLFTSPPLSESGTYTLSIKPSSVFSMSDNCGNTFIPEEISFQTELTTAPMIALPQDTQLCEGEILMLIAGNAANFYEWQNGDTIPTQSITESGNYSVTVSNQCGTSSSITNVQFIHPDFPLPNIDTILCPDETIELSFFYTGSQYQWQNNATSPQITVNEAGIYAVTVTNACGSFERQAVVKAIPPLQLTLEKEYSLCDTPLYLNADFQQFATYTWQNGSHFPVFRADQAGIYIVEKESPCEVIKDTIIVDDCLDCHFFAPNAFSPNGDGYNDYFSIMLQCEIISYKMSIYDRWGGLVFMTKDVSEKWDGSIGNAMAPEGVYIWQLQINYEHFGELKTENKAGSITLLH